MEGASIYDRLESRMNNSTNQSGSIRENIAMPGSRSTQKKSTAFSRNGLQKHFVISSHCKVTSL